MRAAVVASILLLAARAHATPYETFIDVEDQADLDDLIASGDISQETYDELLELLTSGVNLDTADRAQLYALPNLTYDEVDKIIEFREANNGVIGDPLRLVPDVLSQDKVLAIAAFLLVQPPDGKLGIRGFARLATRFAPNNENILPPSALRARFTLRKGLQVGFASTFTRLNVGQPIYDPNRGALVADRAGYRSEIPKYFLKYEDDTLSAIVGTYRAGFAQRLVFSNARHYTPNGLYHDDELFYSAELELVCRESQGELGASPCAGAAGNRYVVPDWSWSNGLMGGAIGAKRIEVGTGWLQGYGWVSLANQSIYQYELVDRGPNRCDDPHDDNDTNCASPTVYVTPGGSNPLAPTSRHSFQTLPDVFQERLVGGNVTYFADRRNSIGATAYGAHEKNLIDGVALDTQEWSRIPTGSSLPGGRFGAAGANFSFGRDWLDVFGEAAFSFDSMPANDSGRYGPQRGGGGPAGVLRVTATRKKEELEAVVRYYGIDFANPYGRPIAQSDEFDGQRARDEMGVRLRYIQSQKLYTVRAGIDLWRPITELRDGMTERSQPKLDTYVRGDVRTSQELWLGLWLRYQDKDLKEAGHEQCYEYSTEFDELGEPRPCGGRQLTMSARAKLKPLRELDFTGMLEMQLLDDPSISMTSFRRDVGAWLIALWRPDPKIRLRGRARYLDEDFALDHYFCDPIRETDCDDKLERSLSFLVDGGFKVRGRDEIRARIDGKFWLDNRAATSQRDPNPEIQVWLSYELRL